VKRVAGGPQQPGLSIFTEGSHTESGAVGYAVTWKRGLQWRCHNVHMGFQQEACGAEYAATRGPLAFRSQAHPSIQTHKQRSDGLRAAWPGQRYALEARKNIATICQRDDRTSLVPCV